MLRRREIRTGFGRLAACVTRNQKGFTPLSPTQCGLKSLSYAHISGGSPKQTVSEWRLFCFTPQARDSNAVRAACRLRNAPIKSPLTLSSYRNSFEILILCAYLRWVTKTKQSPERRLFCFAPQARDSNGVRAACRLRNTSERQQLLCKIRYLHETTSFYRFLPHIYASCFAYLS